jgi:hypothetical protein
LNLESRGDIAVAARTGVAQHALKVYLWPEAFRQMQSVQRSQRGSPRFDLGDLTSAAVSLLAADPHFALRVIEQARLDFVKRCDPAAQA